MHPEFAITYIKRRMQELGHGDNYLLKYRHLVIPPAETIEVDADNDFYYLIGHALNASISSATGVYDLADRALNELQHEHQGRITIVNKTKRQIALRFMQAIPKQD